MRSMQSISGIVLLWACMFIASCEDENLNDVAVNQFVVEGFLFAGEPVDDIRIKSTFPLTDEDDTSVPINDAQVILIKAGQRYPLVASGDNGYYHYEGDDLEVLTNDVFDLEVSHDGITATATTQVPSPTVGLQLSQDSIKVPILPFTAGRDAIVEALREFLRSSSIQADWQNDDRDLYFMVVESVGEDIDPIFPQQLSDALEQFRFVSEPTDESTLTFLAGTLVSYGQYAVKVYHINDEYADLYDNRAQDSRDLNEPPSNVTNALGVFSAFNSQTEFFEVVRE